MKRERGYIPSLQEFLSKFSMRFLLDLEPIQYRYEKALQKTYAKNVPNDNNCFSIQGPEKKKGRREKGEGRREKGEGRREKGEGRREKEKGLRQKILMQYFSIKK